MMRTLDELEKCKYENLTYGELAKYELDCKKYCPLYGEFCSGGMRCYGGEPVEPPCCSFDDNTNLQQKCDEGWEYKLRD